MARYAETTSVSVENSLMEIRRIVNRYGATSFQFTEVGALAGVTFRCGERTVRILMTLPNPDDERFTLTPSGRKKTSEAQIIAAWQQECRRHWRALTLVIKAKLEAVESGITTFDKEFLAHIVLPDDQTVGTHTIPSLHKALAAGAPPALLANLGQGGKS